MTMSRRRSGTEQATLNAILQFLKFHRIPAWHMRTGATKIQGRFIRFGVVGMSDIIGVWSQPGPEIPVRPFVTASTVLGQFLAIEVKSATGKPTAAQQDFLDLVNKAGGKAFVARCVDDVKRELGL